jgi:preprotein translocase subunit SecA
MLAQRTGGRELPRGLDAAWDAAAGMAQKLLPRTARFLRQADVVLGYEKHFAMMTAAKLRTHAAEFRDLFRLGRNTSDDLLKAFALVREVAARQIGLKAYRVQVAGALALYAGCIVEMATGEGKTLAATMPATVAGWCGKGCHVITVNDYLAKRDAEEMGPIYRFCGLKVNHIDQETPPPQRREAYHADITYCTNKEVTADYLRDRLAMGRLRGLSSALLARIAEGTQSGTDRVVQRGLNYAIIDEADSVLIDEGVTPLIISGEAPNTEQVQAFQQAAGIAGQMQDGVHYRVNFKYREVNLTKDGKAFAAELTAELGGIWAGQRRSEELIVQALTAREMFLIDKQYVIQEDKVVIVDDFTGRLMPDREWRDGLHQAVSAKENVEVQPPKDTYARMSFQRFFRMYRRLSGMTGTAVEATGEFWQFYHTPVVVVPTNEPCIRKQLPSRVYASQTAKWHAVIDEITRVHEKGQPILVGTRSVRDSEKISALLTELELEHEVLNAVRHAEEAQIVAQAGQGGRITVATNMAGRGTDIKLGRGVADLGGLYVLATDRQESGRIDRQLAGRSGRMGDPGLARRFVSLEDDLPKRYALKMAKFLRKRHRDGDERIARDIAGPLTRRLFNRAQRRAEHTAFKQRRAVLRTDHWLDEYLGFAGIER